MSTWSQMDTNYMYGSPELSRGTEAIRHNAFHICWPNFKGRRLSLGKGMIYDQRTSSRSHTTRKAEKPTAANQQARVPSLIPILKGILTFYADLQFRHSSTCGVASVWQKASTGACFRTPEKHFGDTLGLGACVDIEVWRYSKVNE